MLLAYNKTASPVVLSGVPVTLPASASIPDRGAPVNVTSKLRGLSVAAFAALESQRGTSVDYEWSGAPEFSTGGLVANYAACFGPLPSAFWLAPITGLDTNSGTAVGSPLKTAAALVRKMGNLSPRSLVSVTQLENNADANDMVQLNLLTQPGGVIPAAGTFTGLSIFCRWNGVRTTASYTDPNTSSTTVLTMTSNTLPPDTTTGTVGTSGASGLPVILTVSGFDFTPHIGKMIEIIASGTSGAVGAIGTIEEAPSLGVAWLQPLIQLSSPTATDFSATPLTSAQYPASTSTFRIYTCTTVAAHINPGSYLNPNAAFAWRDIEFTTATQQTTRQQNIIFEGCTLRRQYIIPIGSTALIVLAGCHTEFAAPPTAAVTAATNASPIVITAAADTTRKTGNGVLIAGALGNTAANGAWIVTRISDTQFSLNGSTGNGAWTSGGTIQMRTPTQMTHNAAQIRWSSCTFRNVDLRFREAAAQGFLCNCLFSKSLFVAGGPNDNNRAGPTFSLTVGPLAVGGGAGGDFGTGFFDWPPPEMMGPSPGTTRTSYGAAINAGHGCQLAMATKLYGYAAATGCYGVDIREGARLAITQSLTYQAAPAAPASPTPAYINASLRLTGQAGDLKLDGQTSHMPDAKWRTAVVAGVAFASTDLLTLATWKDWEDTGTGFARVARSNLTGATIMSIGS